MCNGNSLPFAFVFSFLHDSQDLPVLESTDEREAASVKCCLHLSLRFKKVSEVVFVNVGITPGISDDYRNGRLTNSSSSEIRFFFCTSENLCLAQKASFPRASMMHAWQLFCERSMKGLGICADMIRGINWTNVVKKIWFSAEILNAVESGHSSLAI